MDDEDCEALALEAQRDSGLDDRPHADPSVLAVGWAGLRLRPEPHARAHLADGVIVYPSSASPDGVAYLVGHEMGHVILGFAGARLPRADEERAASRIASALILPRGAFLRDLRALGADLAALHKLWPLASPWVLARRICELVPEASAAQFSRSGRCLRRVGGRESPPTGAAQSVGMARVAVTITEQKHRIG